MRERLRIEVNKQLRTTEEQRIIIGEKYRGIVEEMGEEKKKP